MLPKIVLPLTAVMSQQPISVTVMHFLGRQQPLKNRQLKYLFLYASTSLLSQPCEPHFILGEGAIFNFASNCVK